MRRTISIAALAALMGCCSWAQPADDAPAFEAASVKPSPPPESGRNAFFRVSMDGGPGTGDPARIDYRNCSLASIAGRAYKVSYWQIVAEDWMSREKYDIAATVPPGATKEQFEAMLRRLLADRFKLRVHHETRQMEAYSLTVAKNGPKLKPHVETAAEADATAPAPDAIGNLKADSNGYPILPKGMGMAMMDDKARLQWDNADVAALVNQLSGQLGAPVNDDTGLLGRYDIALYWAASRPGAEPKADLGPDPDLFAAVAEQLGLKLEKKKGPVDILVIDHAEKVPTAN